MCHLNLYCTVNKNLRFCNYFKGIKTIEAQQFYVQVSQVPVRFQFLQKNEKLLIAYTWKERFLVRLGCQKKLKQSWEISKTYSNSTKMIFTKTHLLHKLIKSNVYPKNSPNVNELCGMKDPQSSSEFSLELWSNNTRSSESSNGMATHVVSNSTDSENSPMSHPRKQLIEVVANSAPR